MLRSSGTPGEIDNYDDFLPILQCDAIKQLTIFIA